MSSFGLIKENIERFHIHLSVSLSTKLQDEKWALFFKMQMALKNTFGQI